MAGGLIVRRVSVGREVRRVSEQVDGIELEGRARLRPGQHVDVGDVQNGEMRRAVVASWSVKRVGSDGPMFRGFCRWTTTE